MREHLGAQSHAALRSDAWRRAVLALRASDWWYFAALPLVSLADGWQGQDDLVSRLFGGVLTASFCLAYAYGLNGITDRTLDHDTAKNSLAGLAEVPPEARIVVGACATAAVVAAAASPVALLGATVSLLAGTFYSARLRLKRLPIAGTVVNVLIFAPLPLIASNGRPSSATLFLTYCFLILVTQNQILHEVADAPDDARSGVRTTGAAAGPSGLRAIAVVLGPLAAGALFFSTLPLLHTTVAAAGLCGGAGMIAVCTDARAARQRVSHRWFALVVGVVLFLLIVGVET